MARSGLVRVATRTVLVIALGSSARAIARVVVRVTRRHLVYPRSCTALIMTLCNGLQEVAGRAVRVSPDLPPQFRSSPECEAPPSIQITTGDGVSGNIPLARPSGPIGF
jgi:hypothetical protein